MTPSTQFAVKSPNIVHETINGEAVILDLDTGIYYSLTGAGPEIWSMLEAGRSVEQVVKECSACYDASPEDLERVILELVADLQREQLIVARAPADAGTAPETGAEVASHRRAFQKPTLQRFDDMKDLLLLDPIHGVDAEGWPFKKAP